MNNTIYYVGVDIGKTKISCGLFTENLSLIDLIVHSSGECAQRILDITEALITTFISRHANIGGIGIGTFGVVDVDFGVVLSSGIIKDWNNIPLRKYFEERFHVPVYVENDVKSAIYGESVLTKYKNYRSMLYLSIGTNIGVAFMKDGFLLRGERGRLGEISRYHPRSNPHTLGYLIGGNGLALQYRKETGLQKTCQDMITAAEAGDIIATKILRNFSSIVSDLLHWFSLCYDPGCIVIGGGVICHNPSLFQMIEEQYQHDAAEQIPHISMPIYGTKSGIYGAAALVRNYLHNLNNL